MNNMNNMDNLIKLHKHVMALPIGNIKILIRQFNLINRDNKIKLTQNKPKLIENLLYYDGIGLLNRINNDNPDNDVIYLLRLLFKFL